MLVVRLAVSGVAVCGSGAVTVGAKVTSVSAAVEGVTSWFCVAVTVAANVAVVRLAVDGVAVTGADAE